MKNFYLILLFALFLSVATYAQKPKPATKKIAAAKPKPASGNEKEEYEKAVAQTDLTQKIAALQKFAADFPKSAERVHALELVVSSRAQLADTKLRGGETAAGIELFRQAVADAPAPLSDKLFSEVVLQFPTNLFYSGQQPAAVEIARAIEQKTGDNAKQLLGLATFYIGTENASEAHRLANAAIALDPNLPAAYQTLGLASRLNFQLDEAVAAYTKASELDPNSIVSKRSLAEMKRAVGKSDEAAALYRGLLAQNAVDAVAQTGLILALFDSEKQAEAEAEMNKSLEKNPNNLFLLTSAAYWYAAHNDGAKAVDLAQKAVAVEPRYTWARIALARGLLLQKRFADAEKQLLAVRQYGNFPTLDYELATVRLAAGFYEEAARELAKSFAVTGGSIQTKLGNRVSKNGKNFIELLAEERRASIFEPLAADNPENAAKLKQLLILNQKLASAGASDQEIGRAVNEFVNGDDKAKTHRRLYAANRLLQAGKNLPQVLELTQGAVGGIDAALEIPNAASAVLADELFESRTLAISRGELVVVPDVPRSTLSAILRGRVEEISGWTLFNQNKPQEAIVRLKRAVSILPEKSAWWRSSMWRLGAAFDAADKPAEALDGYIKSYLNSPPDAIKYAAIERVYRKVNGSLDGLDKKIGVKPIDTFAAVSAPKTTVITNTKTAKTEPSPTPALSSPNLTPEVAAAPKSAPSPTAQPTPENTPTLKPSPTPLFGSVVITVPRAETARSTKTTSETARAGVAKSSNESSETPAKSKNSTTVDNSGEVRSPLRSAQNADGGNPENCRLELGRESITILANGGNLGILVGFQGEGDLAKINASSGSPADINVSLEPDIGKSSNREFFVIKSISSKTGIYTVTFDSPCGKKDISVKVR